MPGPNLLTDGGFEIWSSASNLVNWAELAGGGSTVNRESAVVHSGAFCARMDIDASNNYGQVSQGSRILKPATWHRIVFWYKTAAAKSCVGFISCTIGGATNYLQPDGTWGTFGGGRDYHYTAELISTVWALSSVLFRTPAASDSPVFNFGVYNHTAASSSFYVDDAYLEEIGPASYEDLIASVHPQRDLLLHITPKEFLRGWTKTAGYSYTYEKPWQALHPVAQGDFGEKLVDGGFEAWSSPTDLTEWGEYLAGGSTVNRENIEKHGGSYSCRFDMNAANDYVRIFETKTLVPGKRYRFRLWYKTDAGKTAGAILLSVGQAVWLQSDGTWAAVGEIILPSTNGVSAPYFLDFRAHPSHSNYILYLGCGAYGSSAPSSSIYMDDVSIEGLPEDYDFNKTYRALQGIEENGAALTARASVALVDANAGSYYFDEANSKIYVRCSDDGAADRESIYIVAFFRLHFSSGLGTRGRGKIFNDIYYEPLFNASALSAIQSEESDFLTGGGLACGDLTLELLNSKRFFDYAWTTWSWRNAAVEILHGGEDLPLSEYATIYAGYIKDPTWEADRVKFETVNWLELLSRQVPVNPCFGEGVADDARGKPLPLLFGRVTGIQPLCTNTDPVAGTEWTIADPDYQTLKEVEAVYDGETLVAPAYYSVDLADCKFTFVGYTPAGDVTCTAKGAKLSDIPGDVSAELMTNASDIIRFFLLAVLGLSSSQINTTAFAAAKATLTEYVLGKYVRNRKNLATYINEIEKSVLGIVYQENDGRISFDAFSPFYTADATIETQEIAEFRQTAPSERLYAGVQVYYNPTPATADQQGLDAVGDDDAFAVVEGANLRSRYVDGEKASYKRLYTWLTDAASAEFLKQRVLYLTNIPMIELAMTINGLKLFTAKPSDILKINKAIAPGPTGSLVDQFFQIISVSKELSAARCELVVDNFKGGAAQVGIWCSDLAPAWVSATEAEKETQGFWCDDNGLVVPGDWTTANKSVWW